MTDRITSNPEIMSGAPCITGTRIPVSLVLGYMSGGDSIDTILANFAWITREDIYACLDFAREVVEWNSPEAEIHDDALSM